MSVSRSPIRVRLLQTGDEVTNAPALRLYQSTGGKREPDVPVLEFVYREF